MSIDTKALRVLCPLQWQEKGRHGIYGTEGCEFAQFGILEHSVGPAGFEVYTDREVWIATFWHGNRGHQLGRFASQAEAMEAAQSHADKLVASFASALLDAADRLAHIESLAETGTAEAFDALTDDLKLRWWVIQGQRDKWARERITALEAENERLKGALERQKSAAVRWFYEEFDDEKLEQMESAGIIAQAEGFSVGCIVQLKLDMDEALAAGGAR